MKIINRSSIARLALIGGLAASASAIVPGMADAGGDRLGCAGKTIDATANNQTLHGTCGNDTFYIRQFSNVTVYAGNGNDTVRAGFGLGDVYFYLEGGNDTVLNPNDREIWVSGGAGNDTMHGSSGYDAFYGGSGFDSISATPGDFYTEVESYF